MNRSELDRIAEVEALCAAIWARKPAARCFGHLRVRSKGRTRDLILGADSLVAGAVALLDWERAPLAAVFLAHAVDDDYELELDDDRSVEGTVLARAVLRCVGHELRELDDGSCCLRRDPQSGEWTAEPSSLATGLPLRELAQRSKLSSPIEVELDPVQRAAVELDRQRSLLVLGEAGFGKTTVALHRLAHLRTQALANNQQFSALVLVPTHGLRRLILALLDRLGVRDVEVRTFYSWIAKQGRKVFADLPARNSETAPLAVARIKRHPALRCVLPEIINGTKAMREVEAGYRDDEVTRTGDQLLHLFGDRELLERVAARSDGALTPRMIDQLIAHTKVQFSLTTEHALEHVDAERLRTVDGLAIDAGTPEHDAETIDVEDFAVLFELLRLRTGTDASSAGALARYDHIVVDEAQEFAPIELAVIGRARAEGGSITIAGDEDQQVDETIVFTSWPELTAELGVRGVIRRVASRRDFRRGQGAETKLYRDTASFRRHRHRRKDQARRRGGLHHGLLGVAQQCERVVLRESYRCPPAVEAFARSLFTDLPSNNPITDPSLRITTAAHELELVSLLIASLQAIRSRDRLASVAVVCRFASSARRMFELLSKGVDCRLVVDGDFRFGPGVSVTCIDEVKGLEFDYVIVPDATAANYPATNEARRAMYVAATRALARLWLLAHGRISPLLSSLRS